MPVAQLLVVNLFLGARGNAQSFYARSRTEPRRSTIHSSKEESYFLGFMLKLATHIKKPRNLQPKAEEPCHEGPVTAHEPRRALPE